MSSHIEMKLQQHVCGNYFCPKFFSVVSFQLRTGRTWQLLWLNTTIFYLSEKSAHHCLRVFWALTNHEYALVFTFRCCHSEAMHSRKRMLLRYCWWRQGYGLLINRLIVSRQSWTQPPLTGSHPIHGYHVWVNQISPGTEIGMNSCILW